MGDRRTAPLVGTLGLLLERVALPYRRPEKSRDVVTEPSTPLVQRVVPIRCEMAGVFFLRLGGNGPASGRLRVRIRMVWDDVGIVASIDRQLSVSTKHNRRRLES